MGLLKLDVAKPSPTTETHHDERGQEGISTRKVDDLVQAMGMSGISRSEVSRLCEELDEWALPSVIRRALAFATGTGPLCSGSEFEREPE